MTTSTQTQQANSQSAPWQPTQGLLQNLISQLGNQGTGVTPSQSSAINNLQGSSANLPNFGGQAGSLAGGLLSGIPNLNQSLQGNQQQLQNTLSPYLSSSYTNPTTNPQMQQMLQTIQQQTTNAVNSQAAGMGRSGSGDNTEALALGLSQGEAPALLNQYNQNVGQQQNAASSLFSGGLQTAGGMLNNATTGLGAAAAQPGLAQNPAMAQLGAAQTAYGLPFSNIGTAEGLTLPISSLGGQTSGSATTTMTPSMMQSIMGVLGLGSNSLGGQLAGGAGGILKGLAGGFGV